MRVHWGHNPEFPDYWEVTAAHRTARTRGGPSKMFTERKYILREGHKPLFLARAQARMERNVLREARAWRHYERA